MATVTIVFDTDNDAFEGESHDAEVYRILRKIASDIQRDGVPRDFKTIFDVNGNDIGRYAEREQ